MPGNVRKRITLFSLTLSWAGLYEIRAPVHFLNMPLSGNCQIQRKPFEITRTCITRSEGVITCQMRAFQLIFFTSVCPVIVTPLVQTSTRLRFHREMTSMLISHFFFGFSFVLMPVESVICRSPQDQDSYRSPRIDFPPVMTLFSSFSKLFV